LEQNRRVRVVVVDDQAIFRDAARLCLDALGYEVVAEASCAASAIKAVERYQPDGMLLDVHLGRDDGFAVCDAVTRIHPELSVVLTSMEKEHEHARERIESCGARAFVRKEHLPHADFGRFWQAT
jgi:DNA-binding NarL/FixJ family response regulator